MPPPKPRNLPAPRFVAVDLPHFPAQAVAAVRPDLRGRCFGLVEQDAESHKTPVTALSRNARDAGITSGTPVFLARRRWPQLRIVARDPAAETRLRRDLEKFFLGCTPVYSLRSSGGGAALDMTGTPLSRSLPPQTLGERVQRGLWDLGLEAVSVGVAASLTVARVLARRHQPDGVYACAEGREIATLDPLPPEWLPGLSPQARERLRKYGMASIGTVRRLDKEELALRFGSEGEKLYTLAHGLDFETAAVRRTSVIVVTILPRDLNDEEALRNQVRLTADKLGYALRRQKGQAGRVAMTLTYSDQRRVRKTAPLNRPTASFPALAREAENLFRLLYQRRVALRSIELSVAAPVTDTGQIDLFATAEAKKQQALEGAMDRIRMKRSFAAVVSGSNV